MASSPNRAGSPYINRLFEFVNVSCKRNALQSTTHPKCSHCKFEFYIPFLSNKGVFLWNSFRYVTPIKTKELVRLQASNRSYLTVKKMMPQEGHSPVFIFHSPVLMLRAVTSSLFTPMLTCCAAILTYHFAYNVIAWLL